MYYVNGKEYKTEKTAIAAAKKADAIVTDENGVQVYPEAVEADQEQAAVTMTDNVPEGALEENEDGSVNVYNEEGEKVGTASQEEVQATVDAATEQFDGIDAVRVKGKIRRIFNGSLRIRRSPSWDVSAVRGAMQFEEREVTHLLQVDGVPMYRMIDGYFITGDSHLVEFVEA